MEKIFKKQIEERFECKGGFETVNICPNCHYTYHKLVGEEYE